MSIQKLRLKLGWSQQQLAEASGLSVRTIQRIENGQPGSTESLKSLAAVFEVDHATLKEQSMNPADSDPAQQQEAEAFAHVRRLRGFYLHLARYALITLALLAINLIATPHRLWALWVMVGWGLGVLLHAVRVFRPERLLGPSWERRQVEKRLGRTL